ncbi:GtrA family protein [Xanthobacter sp. DSM 24535]|uniref:GtrA family protein n=1 Tax=Roseixanthobacter psychrophilus TaxID=3119917 RepID=UPI0037291286
MLDGIASSLRSAEVRRFARFLAVGLLNTAFGYMVFAAGVLFGLGPELALLVATVTGVAFNFATTGRFVFANRDIRRLPRFALAYAAIYALNALALRGLIDAGVAPLYAQLVLLPIVVIVTFATMRTFVFQEKKR